MIKNAHEFEVSSLTGYVQLIESFGNLNELWFRGVSNHTFKPVPGIIWRNLHDDEATLEHRFLVSYKSYLNGYPLNEWETYTLMQHHGLPTRMLDWSESALVALYFAISSDLESEDIGAVWCISPYELNEITIGTNRVYCPAELRAKKVGSVNIDDYLPPNLNPQISNLPKKPIAINASQSNKRVSSQKGCFTVHGSENDSIDMIMDDSKSFRLIKINVKGRDEKLKMLSNLSKLGIDEEFIYQDLDSLCTRIKREVGCN
ncbi:FRG domain-containing protein [Aeromonas sp. 600276]|uniref:FRG domain-containing protein n=1 Tax=Aeromonas sp. 600276 TaxID=2712026 RepID=UPI003BA37913